MYDCRDISAREGWGYGRRESSGIDGDWTKRVWDRLNAKFAERLATEAGPEMTLRIRPAAEIDLEEITFRIGTDHPASAKRFLAQVAETFELLVCSPYLGAGLAIAAHPESRLFSIRRFRN